MAIKSRAIFNHDGPNMEKTEEVIKALSTVLDSSTTGHETKNHTYEIIQRLVEGYKEQSGEEYTGVLPEYQLHQ